MRHRLAWLIALPISILAILVFLAQALRSSDDPASAPSAPSKPAHDRPTGAKGEPHRARIPPLPQERPKSERNERLIEMIRAAVPQEVVKRVHNRIERFLDFYADEGLESVYSEWWVESEGFPRQNVGENSEVPGQNEAISRWKEELNSLVYEDWHHFLAWTLLYLEEPDWARRRVAVSFIDLPGVGVGFPERAIDEWNRRFADATFAAIMGEMIGSAGDDDGQVQLSMRGACYCADLLSYDAAKQFVDILAMDHSRRWGTMGVGWRHLAKELLRVKAPGMIGLTKNVLSESSVEDGTDWRYHRQFKAAQIVCSQPTVFTDPEYRSLLEHALSRSDAQRIQRSALNFWGGTVRGLPDPRLGDEYSRAAFEMLNFAWVHAVDARVQAEIIERLPYVDHPESASFLLDVIADTSRALNKRTSLLVDIRQGIHSGRGDRPRYELAYDTYRDGLLNLTRESEESHLRWRAYQTLAELTLARVKWGKPDDGRRDFQTALAQMSSEAEPSIRVRAAEASSLAAGGRWAEAMELISSAEDP